MLSSLFEGRWGAVEYCYICSNPGGERGRRSLSSRFARQIQGWDYFAVFHRFVPDLSSVDLGSPAVPVCRFRAPAEPVPKPPARVLSGVEARFPRGQLTMIVGPVRQGHGGW